MKRLVLLMAIVPLALYAEIEWKQKEVVLQVLPTQVAAEAVFEFANNGRKPASIDDVQISCGCLSTQPLAKSYAPGEKGRLVVRFDLLNRTGKQRKLVRIVTDGGTETDLAISTDIPEMYRAEPVLLAWKKGDDARQKIIRLTNPNPAPIKLLAIDSSHGGLPAELKTIREGFEYEVVVTRNPGTANIRSVIRIATEKPPGMEESKTLKLYVVAM